MNWNQTHADHLNTLKERADRYQADGRRINRRSIYQINTTRGFRLPYGTRGYVKSERQYVLDRFRQRFLLNASQVSDQAIWAKYNRLNGGAAKFNKAAALAAVAQTYTSTASHVTIVAGMNVPDRWKGLGLTKLGSGATRTVYDLGDGTVLKVRNASNGWADGRESNKRELGVWRKIANTDNRDFVAEIFAACPDGEWLVMEKVPAHGARTDFSDGARHGAIKRLLRTARYNVSDLHGGNWGNRADGTLVAVDYASA